MMWTQHTREKPAKPGWTIATMAIALVATIALAQLQVSMNAPVEWSESMTVRSDAWPIVFKLPNALDWSPVSTAATEDSDPNEVAFMGRRDGKDVCRISFYHGPDFGILQHHKKIADDEPLAEYAVSIADDEGKATLYLRPSGDRHDIWCRADRLDGSMTSILIQSRKSERFALELAEWICRSAKAGD